MAWHYSIDGEEFGPFEATEFRRLAESGAFGPDDLVWQDGAPQWVQARVVKGLLPREGAGDSMPIVTSPSSQRATKGKPMSRSRGGSSSKRRREFPALSVTAGFFTVLGALAGLGMLVALGGFLSQANMPGPAKGLAGILGLVLTAAVVITYLAVAEMIKLALYVARLLEEIRDSLWD